jgi:hypothetical protein
VVRLSRHLLVDLRDLDILISASKERVGWSLADVQQEWTSYLEL